MPRFVLALALAALIGCDSAPNPPPQSPAPAAPYAGPMAPDPTAGECQRFIALAGQPGPYRCPSEPACPPGVRLLDGANGPDRLECPSTDSEGPTWWEDLHPASGRRVLFIADGAPGGGTLETACDGVGWVEYRRVPGIQGACVCYAASRAQCPSDCPSARAPGC